MPFYGERVVTPDEILPRERARVFEQSVERFRGKRAELYEHALAVAEIDVAARYGVGGRFEFHPAVGGFYSFVAERVDILAREPLEPEKAGGDETHTFFLSFKKPAQRAFCSDRLYSQSADTITP